MIRAVVDANVVISGTIAPRGAPAAILQAWHADYFDLVTCPTVIAEVHEKLRLPRIRKKYPVTDEEVMHLILRLTQAAYLVPGVAGVDPAPPDPKDIMLFAAALESGAEYIVTGDRALLEFSWKGQARIVNPRQFWQDKLPEAVVRDLSYPVFALENLQGTGFHAVQDEQGRNNVALFTTQQAADSYCQKRNVLAGARAHTSPVQLADFLEEVASTGCSRVAFNPTGDFCITESVDSVLTALEQHPNG